MLLLLSCFSRVCVCVCCMLSHFSGVQLFVTLWTVASSGSSVHGILQARILEWVALPSSRGSSQTRDQNCLLIPSTLAEALYQ